MEEVGIIGLDSAENVFQAHGAAADKSVMFERKRSRARLPKFPGDYSSRVVEMGAGWLASAHHRGRTRSIAACPARAEVLPLAAADAP